MFGRWVESAWANLGEHAKQAKHGYIICRCKAPLRLHDKVTALPWLCL
jgi:hypothetical protein